jgi:hypothetical protein
MDTRTAVNTLTQLCVGFTEQSGEASDAFEESVDVVSGHLSLSRGLIRVDDRLRRRQGRLGHASSFRQQDRVHPCVERCEILVESFSSVNSLAVSPVELRRLVEVLPLGLEDLRHGCVESFRRGEVRQPSVDSG